MGNDQSFPSGPIETKASEASVSKPLEEKQPLSLKRTKSKKHLEKRFLPMGLSDQNHNGGIIHPTHSQSTADDLESPDFGWYIRTTPEQKFYSSVFSKLPSNSNNTIVGHSTGTASHANHRSIFGAAHDYPLSAVSEDGDIPPPNNIFQQLQTKDKRTPTGKMTVPL